MRYYDDDYLAPSANGKSIGNAVAIRAHSEAENRSCAVMIFAFILMSLALCGGVVTIFPAFQMFYMWNLARYSLVAFSVCAFLTGAAMLFLVCMPRRWYLFVVSTFFSLATMGAMGIMCFFFVTRDLQGLGERWADLYNDGDNGTLCTFEREIRCAGWKLPCFDDAPLAVRAADAGAAQPHAGWHWHVGAGLGADNESTTTPSSPVTEPSTTADIPTTTTDAPSASATTAASEPPTSTVENITTNSDTTSVTSSSTLPSTSGTPEDTTTTATSSTTAAPVPTVTVTEEPTPPPTYPTNQCPTCQSGLIDYEEWPLCSIKFEEAAKDAMPYVITVCALITIMLLVGGVQSYQIISSTTARRRGALLASTEGYL